MSEKRYGKRVPYTEMPDLPMLIDVDTAARVVGVSQRYVRDLCRDGTIKAAKLGRKWCIDRDALLKQLGLEGTWR